MMSMDNTENPSFRSSRMLNSSIPKPASSGVMPLANLSESQSNVRHQQSGLLPPGRYTGLKRETPQPAAESIPKRQTLAARAGEYPEKTTAASQKQAPRGKGHVQAQSLSAMSGQGIKMPSNGYSSRQGSNTSSMASRQTSNTSFASSVGPGRYTQTDRPKTSMSNRPVSGRSRATTSVSRPQTAYGMHGDEDPDEDNTSSNGTANFRRRKPRPPRSRKGRRVSRSASPSLGKETREASLSKLLQDLSIHDEHDTTQSAKDQVVPGNPQFTLPSPLQHVTVRSPRRDVKPVSRQDKTKEARMMGQPTVLPVTPFIELKRMRGEIESWEETIKSITRTPSPSKTPFLTRDSNTRGFTAFEMDERLKTIDDKMAQMKQIMDVSIHDRKTLDEVIETQKKRVADMEEERERLQSRNNNLQDDLNSMTHQFQQLKFDMETERRNHQFALEDETRKHRNELDELRKELNEETERLEKSHREATEALDRHYRAELEDERTLKAREVQELRLKIGNEQQDMNLVLQKKDREVSEMRAQVESLQGDVDREKALKKKLESNMVEISASNTTLEAKINSLKSHIEFLESDNKAQSDSFANMEARLQDALRVAEVAREKLIKEETERRILFNKYQELKGNIRVMCRVRPVLAETEGESAKITFPDDKTSAEIALMGPEEVTAMGKVSRKPCNFEFDRVFGPAAMNQDVFDEISQLVQSALDGYNVCIFCYGQTGSGKTHTMSSGDGMIPRATHMIYDTITKLKEKSWTYTMEGSFIEVYNEELNDLLVPNSRSSGKKLEIRHDEARKQTHVTNCKTVELDSPEKVEMMLEEAQSNRSVAATKANEHSSRSHSVFILKLVGHNTATGERCEGTLNLVDLAGSERLKQSGAEGDRMRETQNINKSLSNLGDVIDSLGKGSAHVPYRNSKLTYLLQYSLGGNSKTLMFVMVSPLEAHLKETVNSLRFATKVHNTHIGTAKATKKI